jgi:hypothetical protein
MRTRAATVVLLAAPALALGACGSGTKTISKADYVRRGDTICADGQKQVQRLQAPDVDPNGDLTKAQQQAVGDFLERGVKIQNDLVTKLRDLGSPPGDSKRLATIYDTSDAGADQIQKAADAAHAGRLATFRTEYATGNATLERAQREIIAYGLTRCGSSSAPSSGSSATSSP